MPSPTRTTSTPITPTASTSVRAPKSPWVLPDDGIVDPIAIEIAAAGTRRVALTHTERLLAAARILAAGGNVHAIAVRLHVSSVTARGLAARARVLGDVPDLWAAA